MNSDCQPPVDDPVQRGLKKPARRILWQAGALLLLPLISIPFYRVIRSPAKAGDASIAATPVAVVKVKREDLAQELVVEAELRPYQEIDLHAKVAGYLERISVDIGDLVEAGQLLATIEVPELADDINRAEAMLRRSEHEVMRAEAAYEEAHLACTRLVAVEKSQPNLIAQQDLDAAHGKDRVAESTLAATKSQVEVSRAEINKLKTMLNYSQITAPFSGVITRRFTDPGALIQAGTSSSTQALPLVRLSEIDRLRLVFPVSVSYVTHVKVGDPVEIRVESVGNPLFGTVARSSRKVDSATRKMDVEVDVPNGNMTLIPGVYASVVLRMDQRNHALAIPVEALSRSKAATAYVVNQANCIEERTLTLGLEGPHKIEVLSGLKEDELVMIGNRAQVKPGQLVEPKPVVTLIVQ